MLKKGEGVRVRLSKDELQRLDDAAKSGGMTRSDFIRAAVDRAVLESGKGEPDEMDELRRRLNSIYYEAKCGVNAAGYIMTCIIAVGILALVVLYKVW